MTKSVFVESPVYDRWFLGQNPKKSVLICTPFIKNYALEKIITEYGLAEENNRINVDVLIRGRIFDFVNGSSDISALESLIQIPTLDVDNVRRLINLHMKAYLIDNKSLLIGSANFTSSGLFLRNSSGNVEGAITTNDTNVIKNFLKYYDNILDNSESLNTFYDVVVDNYDKLLEKIPPKVEPKEVQHMKQYESNFKFDFKKSKSIVKPEVIPQYSNFDDGAYRVVDILVSEGNRGLTFTELGKILEGGVRKVGAYKKYGENHAKLAELLDFVSITHSRPRLVFLTRLGKVFYNSKASKKELYIKAQILRMAIIKDVIEKSSYSKFNLTQYLCQYLKRSTAKRRKPNVKYLFTVLKKSGIEEVKPVLRKLK